MPDSAADVIADALTHHRRDTRWAGRSCECGARDLAYGDRWEAHLADVVIAALTQSGHLSVHPVKRDYTAEATWRAAALAVVAIWLRNDTIPGAAEPSHAILTTFWPSLANALNRLAKAKADLLKEHP